MPSGSLFADNGTATLESVFRPVVTALAQLVTRRQNGQDTQQQISEMSKLLETLPLSAEEFGLACNRLRKAQRYLKLSERGAARWELAALERHIIGESDA